MNIRFLAGVAAGAAFCSTMLTSCLESGPLSITCEDFLKKPRTEQNLLVEQWMKENKLTFIPERYQDQMRSYCRENPDARLKDIVISYR